MTIRRSLSGACALLLVAGFARAAVPTAPTNLIATAISPGQVNLTWTDNSSDELSFLIERKTGSAGTFAQIASVSTNVVTFGDTGLTASTTYFYRVRASNASGNSAYTNQGSVTTPAGDATPPTAPTGLTATAVSGSQVNLSWAAATDDVGVTGYRVERCDGFNLSGGCTNFVQIAAPASTTYSDTGLTELTIHTYRVRAVDAAGNLGPYSNTASVQTPDTTPPTAPSALTAIAASASQINLRWTNSTDTGSGVNGYQVERCQGATCTAFLQMAFVQNGPSSFIDTGLAVATYRYRVRSIDNAGNLSAYSNIASATTSSTADTTAPSAPTGLAATAPVSNQLNLSWTASTDDIGVTGYLVERCQGTGCTTFAQIAAITATSLSDTGLARATTYRYRVRATDAASNLSAYSSVISATTLNVADTTPPAAPSLVSADTVSASQINLSWTPATDNAGVTGYRLERCGPASNTLQQCLSFAQIAAPTGASFSDTGLSPAMFYQYRVRAIDAAGNLGAYAYSSYTRTLDTNAPTAPTGLTATAASPSRIDLNWTASTDSTGVASYRIERCQNAGCVTFAQVATSTGTSYSDVSLTAGTSYSYRVLAVNTGGSGSAYSNIASATTPFTGDTTPPTAPAGLTATTASISQINLSWTASTDDVGVAGYRVERCQGTGCTTFVEIAAPTATSFSDTGLTAATNYSYRVRAIDAAGNLSGYSNVASATTGTGQVQAYYIYPDHLNTPRLIENASGTTVWRWDQGEPFGNDLPNNNPSGGGAFEFNLRFSGHYFDRETGIAYNYFRDYDPATGRYVQSDPIGIRGGTNTYLFVRGSPLRYLDPLGLDPLSQCEKDVLGFFFPSGLLDQIDVNKGIPWYAKLGAVEPAAFTLGNSVYFAPGQYDPTSAVGLSLLGHEITHSQQYSDYGMLGFLNRYSGDYDRNLQQGMSKVEAYQKIPFEQASYQRQREILESLRNQFGDNAICPDRCGRY